MSLTEADRKQLSHLNEPAETGGEMGVTRYLYEIYKRRTDLQEAFPDLDGKDAERFLEWVLIHGRYEIPIEEELLPAPPQEFRHFVPGNRSPGDASDARWGVNVVGHLQGVLGIGEASRLLITGLDAVGVPVLPIELRPLTQRAHEHAYEALPPAAAGFPINVLCMTPGDIGLLHAQVGPEFFGERMTVGFWWWEVAGAIPFGWKRHAAALDEVWVASRYTQDCLAPLLERPVFPIPVPVQVPEPPERSRAELGLPAGFTFLFIFDYGSVIARKNPLAVIEAFRRAFPDGGKASLVLKCINQELEPETHEQLKAAARRVPGVEVIDAFVSAAEKNAMLASCDCYVALHRSEGFGIPLADAMYLGKPVIATGYSGNLDYMTADNSYLVDFEEVAVGEGSWPYPAQAIWAEPDIDHAAELMRRVVADPEAARAVGTKAAEDIRRTNSPAVAGAAIRKRLDGLTDRLDQRRPREARGRQTAAVDALLAAGAQVEEAAGMSRPRRAIRKAALRLMKPQTEYQHRVNLELLALAAEGLGPASETIDRIRRLELELAAERAEALASARRASAERRPTH